MTFMRSLGVILTFAASLVLQGCATKDSADESGTRTSGFPSFLAAEPWRIARATLYLSPKPDPGTEHTFRFSGIGASRSEIGFSFIDAPGARISLSCDGPYRLTAPGHSIEQRHGSSREFSLTGDLNGRTNAVLEPGGQTTSCEIQAQFANAQRVYRVQREDVHFPLLAKLDLAHQDCADAKIRAKSRLEKAFLSSDGLSATCVMPAGKPELLNDSVRSFNARVRALLGKPLSEDFIKQGNPYGQINFASAPRLKLIVISALDFKADFSGTVIMRLVRHHAGNGTPVRIMASTILERRKDKRLLERLAAEFPNVSLQFFAYRPSSLLDPSEQLAALHRVHHVKLFAVLGEVPAASMAILGGRNIHDGFLYEEPLDLTRYPQLNTYPGRGAMTLNYYTNWHDFDIALHDDAVAQKLIAHFNRLWTSDTRTHAMRSSVAETAGPPPKAPMRHFLSVPYRDGRALEKRYVNLIDAAQKDIRIVNPYLNLTPPLKAAFDRAIARGVKVEIIGRIDMRGDLGGEVLTAVNEKFVSDNFDRMAIRDYRAPRVVLHSKIMLIDGSLSIISSVNLNNRSFLHDTENGVMIFDKAFARRIEMEIEHYRELSDPVTGPTGWTLYQLLLISPIVRQTF